MKLFFSCQNYRFGLNVSQSDTVGAVMERLREKASVLLNEKDHVRLVPYYAGSYLQHEWLIMDIGIPQGSTIRCYLRQELKPSLYIYCNYNHEIVDVHEPLNVPQTPVHQLRSIISDLIGIPLSCYRLISPYRRVMNDSDQLLDHLVDEGMTVRLEVIKGLEEFFRAACAGKVRDVLQLMPVNRLERHYHCKVALFIASHYGHYDLTGTMLSMGYPPDQPCGFHPTIQWCYDRTHFGHLSTPLHQAAMKDNVSILRLSLLNHLIGLTCVNGYGQTPLQIAIQHSSQQSIQYLTSQLRRLTDSNQTVAISDNDRYHLLMSKNTTFQSRYRHYNAEKLFESKTLAQVGRVIEEKDGNTRFTVDSQRYRLQDYDGQDDYIVSQDEHGQPQFVKRSSVEKLSSASIKNHDQPTIDKPKGSLLHRNKVKKSIPSIHRGHYYRTAKASKLNQHPAKSSNPLLLPSHRHHNNTSNSHLTKQEDKHPVYHPTFLPVDNNADVNDVSHDKQSTTLPILSSATPALKHQGSLSTSQANSTTIPTPPVLLTKSMSQPSVPYHSKLTSKSRTGVDDFQKFRDQNSREKALACMDIATTFKSKPWLKQIQLAVKLNVNSCKRSMNSFQVSNISQDDS